MMRGIKNTQERNKSRCKLSELSKAYNLLVIGYRLQSGVQLKNLKTCTVLLSSYKDPSASSGATDMVIDIYDVVKKYSALFSGFLDEFSTLKKHENLMPI